MQIRASDERAALAVSFLRALTRPSVRRGGIEATLAALLDVANASQVVMESFEPRRILRHDGVSCDELDALPSAGPETAVASIDLRNGAEVVGRVQVTSTIPTDHLVDALRYVEEDLADALARLAGQTETETSTRGLAEETERLRNALESVPDGVAFVNAEGRIVTWNQAMADLSGVSASAALLQPWADLLDLRDEDGAPMAGGGQVWRRVRAGHDDKARVICRLTRPSSDVSAWVELGFAVVTSEGAKPSGVAIVLRDVTIQHDVDLLKDDFLATASHELRTPLTPLFSIIELLERDVELDAAGRGRILEAARRQLERLRRLAEDVVTMSELGRGLQGAEATDIDVDELAQAVIIESDDPSRVVATMPGAGQVRSSRPDLARVLASLLDNALKHSSGLVEVHVEGDEQTAEVSVLDRGPGIPAPLVEQALRPFERLGSHLHRTQGPGLGLSIASATSERLGTALRLEARPGGGTIARVRIPREHPAGPA